MSKRYPGGLLSTTGVREPSVTDQSKNSGIWTLEEQYQADANGTWANQSGQAYEIGRSLRFRASAGAYLNRSFPTDGDRRIWTWSFWVKKTRLSLDEHLWSSAGPNHPGGADIAYNGFNGSNQFVVYMYPNGGPAAYNLTTNRVFRDPSAWYHILVQFDTTQSVSDNRIRIYVNGVQETSFATATYPSQNYASSYINSTRPQIIAHEDGRWRYIFDGYLAEWNFIDGQALTPDSFGYFDYNGVWQPKRYTGGYGVNGFYLPFSDNQSPTNLSRNFALPSNLVLNSEDLTSGNWGKRNTTITSNNTTAPDGTNTADKVVSNTTNGDHSVHQSFGTSLALGGRYTWSVYAKAAEYDKIYFYYTSYNGGPYPEFNLTNKTATNGGIIEQLPNGWFRCSHSFTVENTSANSLEIYINSLSPYVGNNTSGLFLWGGQLNLGSSVDPYITTGGSAVNNNWNPNNISTTAGVTYDSMRDSPTNGSTVEDTGLGGQLASNYCTLNPLWKGSLQTLSNANLTSSKSSGTNISDVWGNFGMTSGKWYFECSVAALSTTVYIGIGQGGGTGESLDDLSVSLTSYFYGSADGTKFYGNTNTAYGNTYTAGDVIGCAVDMDNGKIWWSKNGTWQASGDPAAGTNAAFTDLLTRGSNAFFAFSSTNGASNSNTLNWNFGQRPFAYAAPAGFKCLNTANLPQSAIPNGKQHFNILTYTGTAANQRVSGLDFKPDLVWFKERSTNGIQHVLYDILRNNYTGNLQSNAIDAESGGTPFTEIDNTGYTLIGGVSSVNDVFSRRYVSWNWRANGTGVSNTAGTITSTVSANTTAGFSIVSYTGNGSANATVGHGLGTTPSMILVKSRNRGTYAWNSWHKSLSSGFYIQLNTASAQDNSVSIFPANGVTSTVWNTGGDSLYNNQSTITYIAYCFTDIPGYSQFGTYAGVSSADGTFVYTGFRPRFVMVKSINAVGNWIMLDSIRSRFNFIGNAGVANSTNAESAAYNWLDFTSNGFKMRVNDADTNTGSVNYLYAAFAEHPFKLARAF